MSTSGEQIVVRPFTAEDQAFLARVARRLLPTDPVSPRDPTVMEAFMAGLSRGKLLNEPGACSVNDAEGSVTLKVDSAWRPDYVGTEQKRFFKIDNNRMTFGPAVGSLKASGEALTRRLTLERAP